MADIQVPEVKVADQTGDSQVQENLSRTAEEINAEIQEITDKLIEEFEANLDEEMGYQDVMVKSEVLATQADYFTLKLICYQGAGSGYQWNYYYTIDPALAMSGNYPLRERMLAREGIVTKIIENERGFYVMAEFEE